MIVKYPAIFFQEDNGYSVIFPDLNFLATDGKNLTQAKKMAVDCLAGYLISEKNDGNQVIPPSQISSINISEYANSLGLEYVSAFIDFVSFDLDTYVKENFI